jgi:hypothetical protein
MTSTYFESLRARQESAATSGSVVVPATALGILLAVACHSSSPILSVQRPIQVGRTLGTLTQPASRQIADANENDLVRELARVYDELVVDQAEMDEAVRIAIYSDLWGLYD